MSRDTQESRIEALVAVAERWLDEDYAGRIDAIDRSLEADNRFTEAALAFAVNQQMDLLTSANLSSWAETLDWNPDQTVGVLNPGNIPLVELQDLVAVLLSGRSYFGTVSSKSPALLPAFLADVLELAPNLPVELDSFDAVIESSDAVIASGSDETMDTITGMLDEEHIPASNRWIRGHRFSVALLTGQENEDDLVALAEDALLHEGMGCRTAQVIWAPESMDIDPVLDAFAAFRGMFEAHDVTRSRLKMQQAFLKAVNVPHAYADDHQFLISRGDPEPQQPGHVRWSPYSRADEALVWIAEHADTIQGVYSNRVLTFDGWTSESLGSGQRPSLDWYPDRISHASFLNGLTG